MKALQFKGTVPLGLVDETWREIDEAFENAEPADAGLLRDVAGHLEREAEEEQEQQRATQCYNTAPLRLALIAERVRRLADTM